MLSIPKIEGLDLNNMQLNGPYSTLEYASKIQIEYHSSLFYRNMSQTRDDKQMFFFGRTARSRKINLIRNKKTKMYESNEDDHIFFHTSLYGEEFVKHVFVVIEAVIHITF